MKKTPFSTVNSLDAVCLLAATETRAQASVQNAAQCQILHARWRARFCRFLLKVGNGVKKVICSIIVSCIAVNAFAAGGKPPLGFFQRPSFPRTLSSCQTFTLNYTLLNNTNVTLPLTFSTTLSEGTLADNGGTCGSTLTKNSTCTKSYLFTPPDNATSSTKTITGLVQVAYNGRYPLKDTDVQFSVSPDGAASLGFLSNSSFPLTVPSEATKTFYYQLVNHANSAIPITFNPSVPSGSISTTAGGCGSSIAACSTCIQHFTYTAPSVVTETTVTGAMSVSYTHNGAQTLTGTNPVFTVTPVVKPSITITNPNLMFTNRDFGNSGTMSGTLTIQNDGTTTITSISVITHGLGLTHNTSSSTCAGTISLAPNATCTEAFTQISGSLSPNDYIEFTPHNATADGNTMVSYVSSLSVAPLAPPTDTSVGLTLVNGCSDTTNDGGLLMITNNSNFPLSNITISNPGNTLATLTVTDPAFEEGTNVYCNGNTLKHNQYCEVRLSSSAAAGTTGDIIVSGILHIGTAKGSAHHVTIPTEIVAAAGSFPYTFNTEAEGGTIFVANNACNLVEVVSNADQSTSTWSSAATYCSGTISSNSDWRLMDLGPVLGAQQQVIGSFYVTLLSGEALTLNNNNSPLAGIKNQSPNAEGIQSAYWGNAIDSSSAFAYLFGNYSFCTPDGCATAPGNQSSTSKTSPRAGIQLFTRCVRAFTT